MDVLPIFSEIDPGTQATQLRVFLKSKGADIEETNSSSPETDASDLVNACHVLGSLDSENDIEMVLNSIMSLVVTVSDDKAKEIVESFCRKLETSPEFERPKVGGALIRVLSNLFHGFWGTENVERQRLQYFIYLSMLKVATKTNQVRQVPTRLDTLNEWLRGWKVSVEEQRECLRLVHNALLKSSQPEASTKVMLELLGTYTEADAGKAHDDAVEAIRTAIADPGTFIFDHLLDLSPVRKLENESVYKLLLIFVSGNLQEYRTFYSANKEFIDKLPLNDETNCYKMRVLTLMSLGEERQEIPLSELSERLALENGEILEEFIIQAVQSRMIKAKIDQMANKLLIAGVSNRTFEKPQWEQLKSRLGIWTANLHQLKTYLEGMAVTN